jgi:2-C-methyl-D-erythritol 4-phosphate cytidylyltransferase
VAAGVVLASGSGTRVGGDLNKVYLPLAGRRVVTWSLAALAAVVGVVVLVIREQDRELAAEVVADDLLAGVPVEVVTGGASRQDSELMALRALAGRITAGDVDAVLIHDAARPLVTPELATAVLRTAREFGGAIPGVPRTDLVAVDDTVVTDPDLGQLVTVQTPQGYPAGPLLAAYEQAYRDGFVGTDTAACMARYSNLPTRCIPGEERNIKITYPYDVAIVERLMAELSYSRYGMDGVRGVRLHGPAGGEGGGRAG